MGILKTDYVDDVINTELASDRKFSEVDNGDGTKSYEDQTPYAAQGDDYGAKQINFENTHCNYAIESADRMYEGVDLTVEFAEEIAEYDNVWRWLKARISAHKLDGIHVEDYIDIYMGSYQIRMQVAGINTYEKTTDQELGYHIDFISKDLYPETVKWNTTNNNNGNATSAHPYLVSNLKTFLNGLVSSLPSEVASVISEKRFLLESRYSSSGALTDSNSWAWQSLGKLWVPSEYEVFGSLIWASKPFGAGQAVQYPIFANNWKNRIKGAGHNGARADWWLVSVTSGNSTNACIVSYNGLAGHTNASDALRVPVCFRITE